MTSSTLPYARNSIVIGAGFLTAGYDFDRVIPEQSLAYSQSYYPAISNEITLEGAYQAEPVIQLKTTRKISVKIKRSAPLEFVQVEDSEGFV